MSEYTDYAAQHPWIFISFVLAISIWRSMKFLALRLFDDEVGLLPKFIRNIQEDSRETKKNIVESREHSAVLFANNMAHSKAIEERITNKIDEKGEEVKYLLGEVNKRLDKNI